jgi:endonuclease III
MPGKAKASKMPAKGNSSAAGKSTASAGKVDKPAADAPVLPHPVAAPKDSLVNKSTACQMLEILDKRYPDAHCELDWKNDFQLLVAVILSAQTTDVQVNKITPALFARFPTPQALAGAPEDVVKTIIRTTGYYNNKTKSIQACARAIVEHFGGKVPKTLEELVTLPGVGRKTANVVLSTAHGVPGWSVDTHVQRLSQRLGLSTSDDPATIEIDLQKHFPEESWSKYSITLIWHGRRTCHARNPDCPGCPINHLCPSSSCPTR